MIQTYILRSGKTNYYKIGRTHGVFNRIKTLQAGNPEKLMLVAICDGDAENTLHEKYQKFNIRGEWFEFNKQTLKEVIRDMARSSFRKNVYTFEEK